MGLSADVIPVINLRGFHYVPQCILEVILPYV